MCLNYPDCIAGVFKYLWSQIGAISEARSYCEPTGERRSFQNVQKVMQNGSKQFFTLSKTAVSEHMALFDNDEGDIEVKILDFLSD